MSAMRPYLLCAGLSLASASALHGQSVTAATHGERQGSPEQVQERPFVIVENSSMRFSEGDWHRSAPVYRYVHDHPEGDYVVFVQDGAVYRLGGQERMNEVKQLYSPLIELSAKQQALAQAQQSLARQQERIAKSQQALASSQQRIARQEETDPETQAQTGRGQSTVGQTQGDLGTAQGALGQEQGDLGRARGQLGHQQGEIAKAASKRMQQIFDQCLADKSCPRATT